MKYDNQVMAIAMGTAGALSAVFTGGTVAQVGTGDWAAACEAATAAGTLLVGVVAGPPLAKVGEARRVTMIGELKQLGLDCDGTRTRIATWAAGHLGDAKVGWLPKPEDQGVIGEVVGTVSFTPSGRSTRATAEIRRKPDGHLEMGGVSESGTGPGPEVGDR